jgi:hypothetical protein
MLTTTRCGNQAHEHALAHRLDCLHTTRTGDDVAELAEANMSGRVDGALGRQLPDGIDWLATPEWIDAYHAGRSARCAVRAGVRRPGCDRVRSDV